MIPPQIKIGVAITLLISAFFMGYKVADKSCQLDKLKKETKASTIVINKERDDKIKVTELDTKIESKKQETNQKVKVIYREKIKYVKESSDNQCFISNNGLQIINDSAKVSRGTEAPNVSDDSTRRIAVTEIVNSVSDNYISCNESIEKLKALQEYVRGLHNE